MNSQVMDSLLRESEELKEQLNYDKETRLKKQQSRDGKLHEIETFTGTIIIQQAAANRYLAAGKEKYTMLQDKEKEFTESIAINEKEKKRFALELNDALEAYGVMKETLLAREELLETDIKFFGEQTEIFTKYVKETTPGYEELCVFFDKTTKDYENTRQTLISMLLTKYYIN